MLTPVPLGLNLDSRSQECKKENISTPNTKFSIGLDGIGHTVERC